MFCPHRLQMSNRHSWYFPRFQSCIMMIGIKAVLVVSLLACALASGYRGGQDDDLLDELLIRLLSHEAHRYGEKRGGDAVSRRGSWDSYIDNLIAQSKDAAGNTHVDRACIIGLDGGSKWTSDAHSNALKLSDTECADIARPFKSQDFSSFTSGGVWAEGTKYQFLREEDGKIVYAKMKGHGALTLQASAHAIVIAHCPEGSQQGNANKAVGVIAEYLESLGL